MGARLYNPASGAFTSVDPLYGGNTTAYAYPQDPVNEYDVTGLNRLHCRGCGIAAYTPRSGGGGGWHWHARSPYEIGKIAEEYGEARIREAWSDTGARITTQHKVGVWRDRSRIMDVRVEHQGRVYNYEIKANTSYYGGLQRSKDAWLRRHKGVRTIVLGYDVNRYVWMHGR